jgi:hypothetical protein
MALGLRAGLTAISDSLGGLGTSTSNAFRDFFKTDAKAADAALNRALDRAAARGAADMARAVDNPATQAAAKSGIFMRSVKSIAHAGVKLVTVPLDVLILRPVNLLLKGGTHMFTHHRRLSVGAVGAFAAMGIGSWLAKRRSEGLEQEYQAVMAAEPMAMESSMPSYKNSVSEADMARYHAAMAAKSGSHAEGIAQRDASAQSAAVNA